MLKKLALSILILTIFAGFSACSSDDETIDKSIAFTYIIGKWQGVSSYGWEKENGKVIDEWNDDEPDFEYIEFKMDATGVFDNLVPFSWYINDDYNLVIGEEYVGDGTGTTYKIKTLNKDKMILVSEDTSADGWYQEDTYKRIN